MDTAVEGDPVESEECLIHDLVETRGELGLQRDGSAMSCHPDRLKAADQPPSLGCKTDHLFSPIVAWCSGNQPALFHFGQGLGDRGLAQANVLGNAANGLRTFEEELDDWVKAGPEIDADAVVDLLDLGIEKGKQATQLGSQAGLHPPMYKRLCIMARADDFARHFGDRHRPAL